MSFALAVAPARLGAYCVRRGALRLILVVV